MEGRRWGDRSLHGGRGCATETAVNHVPFILWKICLQRRHIPFMRKGACRLPLSPLISLIWGLTICMRGAPTFQPAAAPAPVSTCTAPIPSAISCVQEVGGGNIGVGGGMEGVRHGPLDKQGSDTIGTELHAEGGW